MKGRRVLIEPLPAGGHAAALMVDGRLEDLLIDPDPADRVPRPEAIHRALPQRPMKGLGGGMVDLGGVSGFLRTRRPPPPGRPLLVQVGAWAEPGKAPPVSDRPILKGRTVILTPGAPGFNLSRAVGDPDRRATLTALGSEAMATAAGDLGLILRSAAARAPDAEIAAEIAALRADWDALTESTAGPPACLRAAPGAAAVARREWLEDPDEIVEGRSALADAGIWEEVTALRAPFVPLGQGVLAIEPTRALVAVDVNTGADLSPAAALKANLAAARELPRQLRLRGLGGQVVIDFAPLAKADRARIEQALTAALRSEGAETRVVGWTPLGHLELVRKRARRPLTSRAPNPS